MPEHCSRFSTVLAVIQLPLFVLGMMALLSPAAHAQSERSVVPGELVVTLQQNISVTTVIKELLAKGIKASVISHSRGTNTVLLRLEDATSASPARTNAALQTAFDLDSVIIAEPNIVYRLAALPDDPLLSKMTYFGQINATGLWDLPQPKGSVVVAILDTGVMITHEDITKNLWANPREIRGNGKDDDGNGLVDDVNGWNFVDGNNNVTPPDATERHGTHVAGIVSAMGNNARGGLGLAWNSRVQIMPLRICAQDCSLYHAVSAINYAVEHGARVINLSWGGPTDAAQLRMAIEEAGKKGVLIVAAAGNGYGANNDAIPFYPASYKLPNLIAVAAVESSDTLAGFSNVGRQTVHIAAPGVDVIGPIPLLDSQTNKIVSGYKAIRGTSQAAPLVAATAAVILARSPKLSVQQVRTSILNSGDVVPALAAGTVTGRRLNVLAAINASSGAQTASLQEEGSLSVQKMVAAGQKKSSKEEMKKAVAETRREKWITLINESIRVPIRKPVEQNSYVINPRGETIRDKMPAVHDFIVTLREGASLDEIKSRLPDLRIKPAGQVYGDKKVRRLLIETDQTFDSVATRLRSLEKIDAVSKNATYSVQQ